MLDTNWSSNVFTEILSPFKWSLCKQELYYMWIYIGRGILIFHTHLAEHFSSYFCKYFISFLSYRLIGQFGRSGRFLKVERIFTFWKLIRLDNLLMMEYLFYEQVEGRAKHDTDKLYVYSLLIYSLHLKLVKTLGFFKWDCWYIVLSDFFF